MTVKLKPGSVLAVPVDGKYFACKVIWISKRNRNVIGMTVLPGVFDNLESIKINEGPYQGFSVMGVKTLVIYCDKLNVTRRKLWTIIGELPMRDDDQNLLFQQIGASLYSGDNYIRNLTSSEYNTYPKFLVAGNGAVESYLQQILEQQS